MLLMMMEFNVKLLEKIKVNVLSENQCLVQGTFYLNFILNKLWKISRF